LGDPSFVIWKEEKASELIRGTLQPGDICVYNENPSMCWRWGVAVNVSSWTDEDGEPDVQIHMSGTADYVLSGPLKSDIMVYRIDETGILQDCSDGYFLRPFELAVTAGRIYFVMRQVIGLSLTQLLTLDSSFTSARRKP
jgi:hypothetical protein